MEALFSISSFVATFIAGLAALFAPCCITVLLPSYFASVFREKYKVFLMTFIFFLGISTVFLPIGLGAGFLSQILKQYHNIIFGSGGIFLMILAIILLTGTHFSLPFRVSPSFKKHNAFSVYTLGIFSGIATTCCAPVLAGVLTLSILPGSFLWGGVYSLSYVLGMVAPLFIISLLIDKSEAQIKFSGFFRKNISYSIIKRKFSLTISELISGLVFLLMGSAIIYLAITDKLFVHSPEANIFIVDITSKAYNFLKFIPEYTWALFVILAVGLIIFLSFNQFKKENK
ncbi:MAG: Cytochrome c bioproteinis protein transmembrane region [Parcubacteria group bacterium Licking1014_1]|nr:MAG: Cytochrome c bioproteinis protein transmembrane region [Parcubacteria group bacterium Licking1014_1]